MRDNFKIVVIESVYCDYLRQFDNRVSYNAGIKKLRPYVGVLFSVKDHEYFAPLSSPKPKHKTLKNTLDLIKIDNGKLGVININNMIPVHKSLYNEYDLSLKNCPVIDKPRRILLRKQLRWLNGNKDDINLKCVLLYKRRIKDNLPRNVIDRCCDYELLEKKCKEYLKATNKKYQKC